MDNRKELLNIIAHRCSSEFDIDIQKIRLENDGFYKSKDEENVEYAKSKSLIIDFDNCCLTPGFNNFLIDKGFCFRYPKGLDSDQLYIEIMKHNWNEMKEYAKLNCNLYYKILIDRLNKPIKFQYIGKCFIK